MPYRGDSRRRRNGKTSIGPSLTVDNCIRLGRLRSYGSTALRSRCLGSRCPTGLPAHPPPCHLPLPPRAQTGAPGRAGHPGAAAHPAADEDRKRQLASALIRRATPRGRAGWDTQPGGGEERGNLTPPPATSPSHLSPHRRILGADRRWLSLRRRSQPEVAAGSRLIRGPAPGHRSYENRRGQARNSHHFNLALATRGGPRNRSVGLERQPQCPWLVQQLYPCAQLSVRPGIPRRGGSVPSLVGST